MLPSPRREKEQKLQKPFFEQEVTEDTENISPLRDLRDLL